MKRALERKIKTKENLKKINITNDLHIMNDEVKLEKKILDKYNKTIDKKLVFLDKHKEIKKKWKKLGLTFLTAKAYTPRIYATNNNSIISPSIND